MIWGSKKLHKEEGTILTVSKITDFSLLKIRHREYFPFIKTVI